MTRRILTVGLMFLLALVACDEKLSTFFEIIERTTIPTGSLTGLVRVDGQGRGGVAVTLRDGQTVVDTETTTTSGRYTMTGLGPGLRVVSITAPSGTVCPTVQRNVTIVAGQEATADFDCTTPVQDGTINGQVTVNSLGQNNVPITLRQGTTVINTQNTSTSGNFTFTGLASGTFIVSMVRPSGATCDGTTVDGSNEKTTTLPAGGTQTVNFTCTPSVDFTVNLTSPPPGWNHTQPGVESVECKVVTTNPPQAGATFTVTATGPSEGGPSGVIPGPLVGGPLDANGRAAFQVRINRTGTYTNVVTVVSGLLHDIVRTGTATVTVTGAPNTCPTTAPSSRRFKQGIVALLPDHASVLGLRPVAFRYLAPYGDPGVPQIGLIAEEVVRVFPSAVALEVDGRPYGIDYRVLTGLMIEEIQTRTTRAMGAGIVRLAGAF